MFGLDRKTAAMGLAALLCLSGAVRGELIVRFDTPERTVGLGEEFTIDILADILDPLVGWGLDLSFDSSVLALVDSPAIGPRWFLAPASDADGLAGLAFPDSVSGVGVLLASVTLSGMALGETDLTLSTTLGDLSEGFALDPTGFAQPTFESSHVFVVPEPATGLLGAIVLSIIGLQARRWIY